MSNPYDPNQGPDQNPPQNPYGTPQGQPYGAPQDQPYGAPQPGQGGSGFGNTPYGGDNPYGNNEPKSTDAVSITGFVLSLTCCLSIVGAILGIIGLGRTKNNQRKGRWAAISALIIGVVGTLAFAGIIVFVVFLAKSTITLDNAEVGQCMNVTTSDDSVTLLKKDCSDTHDAQIVYLGTFDDILNSGVAPSNPDDVTDAGASRLICSTLIGESDLSAFEDALGDDIEFGIANEDSSPTGKDKFLCYVANSGDKKLDSKIG